MIHKTLKKGMNGDGLVVNDPVHLSSRPLKRMLVPGMMNNANGDAAKESGPAASYYTTDGCTCNRHNLKGAKQ